ncbi:uncharacterized protein PRCAT00003749001 [Priceomyces carsonii]|uniref:uncharacterized protein n=1 Tax=Priceomyces carsonii TaxID=28549 RepID=UPI002EDB8ECC|nr:unnamed protein product [Priceomyces carsonii]
MTSIDPTEYIEAVEGAQNLRFINEKQQAKFELGVCMAVYRWDELNTAVDNSWGGPKSADKRDWISGIVIDLLDEKIIDIQLIEETLLYAMLDEFDTEVDNESALEIAALIMKIYKEVLLGQYATVDDLYNKWLSKGTHQTSNGKVTVQEDPANPDILSSEDDDDEDGNELNTDNNVNNADNMEVDSAQGPLVDDEGFELVTKRGRKRHN